jgi:hypothetical protein
VLRAVRCLHLVLGGLVADSEREPLLFVAEEPPVMNPDVAVVLARIVRTLRERQERDAA